MDRFIHTALNSLNNFRDSRVMQSHNLANQMTPGYRRDLPNEGKSHYLQGAAGGSSVAFQLESGRHTFSDAPGPLNQTGEAMDIAIVNDGYFFIQPEVGEMALTRRGDLNTDATGRLVNGAGHAILSNEMAEIVIPPYRSITINDLGQIYIEPQGGEPGLTVQVATIGTTIPGPDVFLSKSPDGLIRVEGGGALPPADQQARLAQGTLEGSNVNTIDELIATIETQRQFELGVRMIDSAKEIDQGGASLMRAPDA